MEVGVSCKLKYPTWIESERFGSKSTGSLRFGRIAKQGHKVQVTFSAHFPLQTSSNRQRSVSFKVSCSSYKNFSASTLETGSIRAPYDEALMLKNKSLEVEPYLNGHSIYLIGSVGKILSQVLGYSFNDSDALIEQEVNGMSVAEIFKHHGQSFFRKKETEILQRLSLKKHCGFYWRRDYMQEKGIVIWLDVPLEALARRIAAVGTHSRPLLHYEHGDPYTKALKRLSSLLKQRGKTYAKANARVSLEEIPGKLGYRDVSDLTPTEIAVEALEQIEGYVKEEGGMAIAGL
ncbi:hypothetical protein V6N12_066484 [Hibiscus sabdariffa]|uniref:Uncharacterized protein n=1 Tax=Hibiscus sabdariffa TaxID=183260 RepID=A0ABR2CQ95_9ROSI